MQSTREQEIFEELCSLDEPQRTARLHQACGSDTELASRLTRLLTYYAKSKGFLNTPAWPGDTAELGIQQSDVSLIEAPGTVIGPYRLAEPLGEGGMGIVYLAEQQQPIQRQVALKVIKPGMDTRQVIARFESERQALALMEHENIARVLDAGATNTGRPYFVMEVVRGPTITEYCRDEKLDTQQKLSLFVDTCRAVQHAHLKGIIHRDIKPSNVMIATNDSQPVVKMIDFGVAKATHQSFANHTVLTQTTQVVGTPLYMSPEQAEFGVADVDTRSDVYSLGALLYELLTDLPPFDRDQLRGAGPQEMLRMIRELEPVRPSQRVSSQTEATVDTQNRTPSETTTLSRSLRGELDWIVVKALDKQPDRRYQSAGELADDVQRFLINEPVEACPPSIVYQLGKTLRKHRTLFATGVLTALILVAATAVSAIYAIKAQDAEAVANKSAAATKVALKDAQTQAELTKEINDFFRNDILGVASPFETSNRDLRLREALDRAGEKVAGRFDDQPLVEAGIQQTLGTTYLHMGEYKTAHIHLYRAFQLRSAALGTKHVDTLESMFYIGLVLYYYQDMRMAASQWRLTHALQSEVLGPDDPATLRTMSGLAYLLYRLDQDEEAWSLIDDASERFIKVCGPEHPDTLDCLYRKANMLPHYGKFEQGLELSQQVLEARRRILGEDHPQFFDSLCSVACALKSVGRFDEAVSMLERCVEWRRTAQGPSHRYTMRDTGRLASAYEYANQLEKAAETFKQYFALREPDVLASDWHRLGMIYVKLEQAEPAIETLNRFIDLQTSDNVADLSPDVFVTIADMYALLNQPEEAAEAQRLWLAMMIKQDSSTFNWYQHKPKHLSLDYPNWESHMLKAIERQAEVANAESYDTIVNYVILADLYIRNSQTNAAQELLKPVANQFITDPSDDRSPAIFALHTLGVMCRESGLLDEANHLFTELLKIRTGKFGTGHAETMRGRGGLGRTLFLQGRWQDALEQFQITLEYRREQQDASKEAFCLQRISHCLNQLGQYKQAEQQIRLYIQITQSSFKRLDADCILAASLIGQDKLADAESLLLDAWQKLKRYRKCQAVDHVMSAAKESIIDLYEARGDKVKVAEWTAQAH